MPTSNQSSDMNGGFTPTTAFTPNRLVVTNDEGYAESSDITVEQLSVITSYSPPIIVPTPITTANFTNTYLNTTYPVINYPIGAVLKFTNITDLPLNTGIASRIGTSAWDLDLTTTKLS